MIRQHGASAIIHFAARIVVPDSVADPLGYYLANTVKTRAVMAAAVATRVKHFIFSSTAAVYGIPADAYADEQAPTAPINPYGTSKLMSEWMLRDVAAACGMRYAALRYFNVAGSDSGGRIGQSSPDATLLVKVAVEAAVGKRAHVALADALHLEFALRQLAAADYADDGNLSRHNAYLYSPASQTQSRTEDYSHAAGA